jgi:hypothetical protein
MHMTRKINSDEMERRMIYLRGYYNGLVLAETDGTFDEVYREIRDNLIWAMGDEPQETNGET